jgi:hypothetical protein
MSIEEELRTLIERNYVKLLDQLATVTRLLDARDQGGTSGTARSLKPRASPIR